MRSSRRREALSAALALLLAACARPAPAPVPAYLTPAETVAAYAAREAAIDTLRAQFSAVATAADGSKRRVSGVFVVSRSTHAARFRLMLPLGITVLDYVNDGTDDWLTLPLTDEAFSPNLVAAGVHDPPSAAALQSSAFTADMIQSYLRPAALTDCQTSATQRGQFVAVCEGHYLVFSTADGTLMEDRWNTLGQDRRRKEVALLYSDQRPVDGVLLPHAIAIRYLDGASIAVTVDHYDLNPTLAPTLFDLPPDAERAPVHIDYRWPRDAGQR